MKKLSALTVVFGAVVLALSFAHADHHEAPAGGQDMPPMGPPEEMKQVAEMAGTWDVAMSVRMEPDPESEMIQVAGECAYQYILGGAAMEYKYTSTMMGMPFEGRGAMAFNRETGKWQSTWMENLGARISLYEGSMEGDNLMLYGVDHVMGEAWLTRITQGPIKDGTFNWMMEHSTDDGETWVVYVKSKYTKRM